MKKLIIKLVSLKVVQFQNGDTALAHYNLFLSNKKVHHEKKLLSFGRQTQRLDDFFIKVLKSENNYPELASTIKTKRALNMGSMIIMLF